MAAIFNKNETSETERIAIYLKRIKYSEDGKTDIIDFVNFRDILDKNAFWSWLAGEEHEPRALTRKDWEQR
ncbi:MAG TPA: hypothetical protein GXX20_06320 [Clostridiaceae bacterium]|nr:hypothetical protein [Clostridiaceae bacterium]